MKRIALASALIIAAVVQAIPARAGFEVVPTAYNLLKGTQQSDAPLTELANNDDDYLTILSGDASGNQVASYQVTFSEIPVLEGTVQIRIVLIGKGVSPECVVRMWHWKKRKFIAVSDSIPLGGSEAETTIDLLNPGRFVKNAKAKSRVTCKDGDQFISGVEMHRFIP